MEEELRWVSNAFYFFIQKLGHSVVPPPHSISGEIVVSERAGCDGEGVADDCQLLQITEAEKEDAKTNNPADDIDDCQLLQITEAEKEDEDASSQDVIVIGAVDEHIPHNKTRKTRASRRHKQSKQLGSQRFADHLENIWSSLSQKNKSRFSYLDSFVFQKYMDSKTQDKGLGWIKKRNIFGSKFLILPIVIWGHWVVTIFCNIGGSFNSNENCPCILFLDSLISSEFSKRLESTIKRFLIDIYKICGITADAKVLRKIPFLVPKVPQQTDGDSCGYYALYYIKLFLENAPQSFNLANGYPYFMKEDWFHADELDSFRLTLT